MRQTCCALLALLLTTSSFAQKDEVARWEKAISAFEKQDKENPPPKGAVLFTGSSSIKRWNNLAKTFPDCKVINRGFGGSTTADCNHFIERIVLKHEPRLVVLYAGENDLAKGKTPAQVLADFRTFVSKLHERLPKTPLLYISIKLSPKRKELEKVFVQTNKRIAEECADNPLLTFVDIYPLMLTSDGKANAELYADGLHANAEGYALWAKKLRPLLSKK